MRDIHDLIQAAKRTIPEESYPPGVLVHPQAVRKELEELQDIRQVIERMMTFKRAADLIHAFSLDAAKQLVLEMKTAKQSGDRLKAIFEILNRDLGRPVERRVNLNMEVSDYSTEELDKQIQKTMAELGYTKAPAYNHILIDDGSANTRGESAERGASPEPPPPEGGEGSNETSEICA